MTESGSTDAAPSSPVDPAADDGRLIELDYPVNPEPRYGWGKPSHPKLHSLIDARRHAYARTLQGFLRYVPELVKIPLHLEAPVEPCWMNGWIPGLDAVALYATLVDNRPGTYVEVGSGWSTKFARRAVDDFGLPTRLVSIDPQPRAEINELCHEVIRSPFEAADLSVFERLGPGDVVFVDNSHRAFTNSDVTVFFLDVLPYLPPGVLVQMHDIWLPDDYPSQWNRRFYSEQYLLATWLLAEGSRVRVELPNWFIASDPELSKILDPLWNHDAMQGVEHHGGSFWVQTTERGTEVERRLRAVARRVPGARPVAKAVRAAAGRLQQ